MIKGTDDRAILRLYEFAPEFDLATSPIWPAEAVTDVLRVNPETCRKEKVATIAPAELLYTYKGYGVIHAGGLYVGVAQDVGPVDVDRVLANTAPRPPADQFITAGVASELEAKIDVHAKEAAATAPPTLLYAYKGYNLVRARGLYVAVAQNAGPMDVGDVLTNAAPRPPTGEFIIAQDASSLEAAIDAYLKDTEPAGAGPRERR